ncbi:MAG: Ppx/GppA phosphatase family protein [Ornithinimicrobium sp.]
MSVQRVAAVDCGTNSIRLLVADVDPGAAHPVRDVARTMQIVRLGRGVDALGRFDSEALARTLEVAREYAGTCRDTGAESVRFIATSATRDAANAEEFTGAVAEIFADFGVSVEVISGQQEAALSFVGATAELGGADSGAPYLVVDIGGGSTEFVRGTRDAEQAMSVDIGCVRMTERHLVSDPPSEEQVWAALADITSAIDRVGEQVDLTGVGTLIGLAGSVTTVTAATLGLSTYDPSRIHAADLAVEDVIDAATALVSADRSTRSRAGYMHPGRIDVIGAGALIWRTVVQRLVRDSCISRVRTSEHDILDGLVWSQVRAAPGGG